MLRVLFVSDGPLKEMPRETHYGIVNVRSVTPAILDHVTGTHPDIVIICGEVEQWVLDEIHALNPDTILKR